MRELILASTSPQRKEILEKLRIPFTTEDSGYEEDMTLDLPAEELVKHLALGKAREVASRHSNAVVIGGDTIVAFGGAKLGKPHSSEKAVEMLRSLSGKTNVLLTAVAVIDTERHLESVRLSRAEVYFRELTDQQIEGYVATGEPIKKAGAYSIQGYGAAFIKEVRGDFFGAMGLPLSLLQDMFEEMHITYHG